MLLRKYTIAFLICFIGLKSSACEQIQQNTDDPAVIMLKEFYIAYNTAWSTANASVLIKKLDSLKSQYCTLAYQKELKKEFKRVGLDHDELINDDYTDVAHLNTLKVIKQAQKENDYIVSYLVFSKDVSNKPIQIKIIIHVKVVKEHEKYKIAAAK